MAVNFAALKNKYIMYEIYMNILYQMYPDLAI